MFDVSSLTLSVCLLLCGLALTVCTDFCVLTSGINFKPPGGQRFSIGFVALIFDAKISLHNWSVLSDLKPQRVSLSLNCLFFSRHLKKAEVDGVRDHRDICCILQVSERGY